MQTITHITILSKQIQLLFRFASTQSKLNSFCLVFSIPVTIQHWPICYMDHYFCLQCIDSRTSIIQQYSSWYDTDRGRYWTRVYTQICGKCNAAKCRDGGLHHIIPSKDRLEGRAFYIVQNRSSSKCVRAYQKPSSRFQRVTDQSLVRSDNLVN